MENEIKFESPQEELEQLKKRIQELESVKKEEPNNSVDRAKEALKEHINQNPEKVLSQNYQVSSQEASNKAVRVNVLKDEGQHQEAIKEFLDFAGEKGVLNAATVLNKVDDPHLADELHDALVGFVMGGLNIR